MRRYEYGQAKKRLEELEDQLPVFVEPVVVVKTPSPEEVTNAYRKSRETEDIAVELEWEDRKAQKPRRRPGPGNWTRLTPPASPSGRSAS